ncbi:carboxylating nicotinate-nucleotide diphosphorylase [Halodesulfovibrio sp. MK-HDV]|jgi:nicotinate-nucleotide pyrophosphorylase (carboxylating)|uniref:carboxylating nicotinate-nucleotide diphosphorylase n=1 Tax=unclassified Halodesulfovibrio TaxID=2644657 RepID=UPI001370B1D6|nr:carboxylating nicotinate-nucleotide diphosphorylase [Halodesulfovibrio sp. MK-HDV]KAF1074783.1 Nicotinate-nucleotide pyrophosphorylase (carboxylating) [Halodesulfovibrio sp. MK-HDV]
MHTEKFDSFFQNNARIHLNSAIKLALDEDGPDLTSEGIFPPGHTLSAQIISKEDTLVVGLPLIPLIMDACADTEWSWNALTDEGDLVPDRTVVATIKADASHLLKAERIILNFITHLSGIANLTKLYVDQLKGSGTALLDTRKTLPCLRYPEKYAVLMGGGQNHRKDLTEMLMLKDNHIDLAGNMTAAVEKLRATYSPCPPIEVECRNMEEVHEAVACHADRIMLDNMDIPAVQEALKHIPESIETEASGGVTLETIRSIALASDLGPDYISVGRLTHSAPIADFSMLVSE